MTFRINHAGSVRLAQLAKAGGVTRFVYMSSCSVYGAADGDGGRDLPVNPQTAYAECKMLVERDLTAMADDDFSPTFMRNATAYGASPANAVRHRAEQPQPASPGRHQADRHDQRRHPVAAARAYPGHRGKAIRCALEAPREVVHDADVQRRRPRHNYRVREIAEIVAERPSPGVR